MEQDIDVGVEVPEVPELPQVPEGQQDTTDWKAIAQERQDALAKMQGMTKRFQTKLKKLAEAPKPQGDAPKPSTNQGSKGLDYGQLAYLESKGVSDADDQAYIEGLVKESGMELRALLGKPWVQSELKERLATRTTAAAVPKGTPRGTNPTQDTVDYWLTKIDSGSATVKDIPDRALRIKVVNAKIARANAKSQFYNS